MTDEEIKEQFKKLREFLEGEINGTMKESVLLDLKSDYGDPDPERQKAVDEKLEELETHINDLLKPKSLPNDVTQDAYDAIYGKDAQAFGRFAIDVKTAANNPMPERLQQYKTVTEEVLKAAKAAGAGLQENVDSEGGFLVPTEQSNELLTMGEAQSQLFGRVRKLPMSSNNLKLNYIKETDRSGGALFGGVQIYWVAEEGTTTATKPALGQVTLSLNKMFGLAYVTSELIEDSPISMGPWLSQQFSVAFGWQMDYEIINGGGTGRPEGILNSNALISIVIETGQAAATIEAQNVIKAYARMASMNRSSAIFVANDDTLPQLMTMVLTAGTAGVPVWLPANSLAGRPHDNLMGKEILYTEHCQTLGTVGDFFFFAPDQYLMGMKSTGVRADTSIHLKFETDETAFRFIWRVDGKCPWPSALTPRHSADTQSPIIAIATRS